MTGAPAVSVVGMGADGCASLPSHSINAVARAQVLVGGERQLAFFPEFEGERITVQGGLSKALDRVVELADEQHVCVLASGDPLFFGIGSLVVGRLGAANVELLPQPSSVQWAFAKIGLKWDDAAFLSLHGRRQRTFLSRLRGHHKVACMTDDECHPGWIAQRMREAGENGWDAWVCEELGGPDERVRHFAISDLAETTGLHSLNVVILVRRDPDWRAAPAVPYLAEDELVRRKPKKGLITKREVRTLSLASMRIPPDGIVWDVGAGSGAVAIEAAMMAPRGQVYAIEVDPEGAAICRENAESHGADNVNVVEGRAPEVLSDLPAPDAVFVGGSKGSMDTIVEQALGRLSAGGRVVVNAITMENVHEAYQAFRARDLLPEVTLVQVSRGAQLAGYVRYEALNPVHVIAASKPHREQEAS